MTRMQLWDRAGARRVAVVDGYRFPSSVRQRFGIEHGSLSGDDISTVEAATRQWFRLAARNPKARLAMPSVVVDDLWHEFVLHTREYAEFCDAALGRFLHHTPETAMSPAGAAGNRRGTLAATFRLAEQDEGVQRPGLPLLFRVDREVAVEGGHRYLADCGGRGICYELQGMVCLQHLAGPENLKRRFNPGRRPDSSHGFPAGNTCGGGNGCGGGGCGGN
jgi:hypothetical protein